MEQNELDFRNDLADLIESTRPTTEELGRLAARCGIDLGRLEGRAIEVRIGLLVQSATRSPILVDRLYKELPTVFPHLDRKALEVLHSRRPSYLRHEDEVPSIVQGPRSAARSGPRLGTSGTVDVLLIVATEIERESVLSAFEESGHAYNREFVGVNSYWIYPSEITSVGLVQCRVGSGGPGGSMLTSAEAITALSPEAVIMPGIAFGVDPQRQHIGDILLALLLFP